MSLDAGYSPDNGGDYWGYPSPAKVNISKNLYMYIELEGRKARIIKVYNDYAWRLQFTDNAEIINVFYYREENFSYLT
jgi:hypothetical protein